MKNAKKYLMAICMMNCLLYSSHQSLFNSHVFPGENTEMYKARRNDFLQQHPDYYSFLPNETVEDYNNRINKRQAEEFLYGIIYPNVAHINIVETLHNKLDQFPLQDDFNFNLVARYISSTMPVSLTDVHAFIDKAIILAEKEGHAIGIKDFEKILTKLRFGRDIEWYEPSGTYLLDNKFTKAIHESGHAIAILYRDRQSIILNASIIPKSTYSIPLAGGCNELLGLGFGSTDTITGGNVVSYRANVLDDSKPCNYIYSIDDLKGFIIHDLAAGCAEQIFNVSAPIDIKLTLHKYYTQLTGTQRANGFKDFSMRTAPLYDLRSAIYWAKIIAGYEFILNEQGPEYYDESEIFQNRVNEILEECYQEAYQLILYYKDDVERLAHALMERKTISGDEIYAMFNVPKPKCDFELIEDYTLAR